MGFYAGCKTFAFLISSWLWPSFEGEYVLQTSFGPGGVDFPSHAVPSYAHWPEFPAPNGPENDNFTCRYPLMGQEWTDCSTPGDRSCWLKGPGGQRFDIYTDYESVWPTGVTRKYYLEVNEAIIDGDGIPNKQGKTFNSTYPGPWIKACWGDTVEVSVKNKLRYNGTTIHWHGLRQLHTPEMDGVNGVTQCPIAPDETMTYTFNATQYGTSWAHSHYSLQYADGLLAPITIFGPSAAPYDEALDPILITDWNHRSAFEDWNSQLRPNPNFPQMNSMLINGKGNFAGTFPQKKFTTGVKKGTQYLLRIINTSVDTTWIFSIDNHRFTVMSSDFVPIHPYETENVTIGIGQRYHIVLNATPIAYPNSPVPVDKSFWIRAISADNCKGFEVGNEPDERQGILRYDDSDETPTTYRQPFSKTCKDEPYEKLRPIYEWQVPPFNITDKQNPYAIHTDNNLPNKPLNNDNFAWWNFGNDPLWLKFSSPTIANLENTTWDKNYVIISEDLPDDAWIYMVITAPARPPPGRQGGFLPVAHPIHLHGHDFALLAQGTNSSQLPNVPLKFDNPPRRDVVLLPAGGYVVIAFRADNPGSWLFHCHIPWHVSAGLALQVLERQSSLKQLMTPDRMAPIHENCAKWDRWYAIPENRWLNGTVPFQEDSGV